MLALELWTPCGGFVCTPLYRPQPIEQWFSPFLMLRPLNTVPHVVLIPNHNITSVATS